MLKDGIIRYENESSYNSPLIVVKKPNNQIRIVHNFVALNDMPMKEKYTMTNQNEMISKIAIAKWQSRLDLSRVYFQVMLTPESQPLTAFQTDIGTFSYLRMPMGLCLSAATCQRLMDIVLRGAPKYSGTLIDDTTVFSKTFEDHLIHLRDVLDRLRYAGLTVNTRKCQVATKKLHIFGFVTDNGQIYADQSKVQAILDWPLPGTKKRLRSFLGLTNYFHSFINRYAEIAFLLTEKLAKSIPDKLVWTEKERKAFHALRTALTSKPVLRAAHPDKPMIVYADASKLSVSCIVMQSGDAETEPRYVMAYGSRKLLPRERNYAIVELELLSIVHALQKFHHLLYGRKIQVFTDHRPLSWLASLSKHNPRHARWSLFLQEYDISTHYISGREQLADCLTRLRD